MFRPFDYDMFVKRNEGYVAQSLQTKFREMTLLIAGCGIGSSPAICAARMGFEKFVLVDGDIVDSHNLNRQFYDFIDVGRPKVEALRDAILRINPNAQVEAINSFLNQANTSGIIAKGDLVFDTVDFLDLPAILGLHLEAHRQQIPIFTALSVGFGALVWYFPADSKVTLADILAPEMEGRTSTLLGASYYAEVFGDFILRLAPYLDREVMDQVSNVLTMMRDGRPCPASQVAVGSFSVGALALSMIRDALSGFPVPAAPSLVIHSFHTHQSQVVNLAAIDGAQGRSTVIDGSGLS